MTSTTLNEEVFYEFQTFIFLKMTNILTILLQYPNKYRKILLDYIEKISLFLKKVTYDASKMDQFKDIGNLSNLIHKLIN